MYSWAITDNHFLLWQTHTQSENSVRTTVSPTTSEDKRVYSVKVMNQGRKREYTMQKLTLDNNFSTVADMKESLTSGLKFPFDNFGYIEPGHGLKGRQQ